MGLGEFLLGIRIKPEMVPENDDSSFVDEKWQMFK
jgi:hypothetical protein